MRRVVGKSFRESRSNKKIVVAGRENQHKGDSGAERGGVTQGLSGKNPAVVNIMRLGSWLDTSPTALVC